ncbi:alpha/beta hydrolase [Flavobacterium granuli]|uniref:S-formylglutathione hydrolase FrmB n=1 Tax=Flavobacterium granuli TaxID=280093 RepID=A0A1M5TW70_9FLAO|nr:alpha/beta hydrolase family protein [Flavobacterium granuli]PRZ22878.1 S-formylglutathione hydrolase FrmB [Flavobacterium granuli]SHH54948.1 S-formylglutathione hydrolase FrmB [Flavobacterium granuli]
MKKIIYVTLLVFVFFSAKAAKVDTLDVFSPSMKKYIKTCVITPDSYKKGKKKFPVVYLLHGYGGNYATWVKSFKEVAQQADKYGFIVIGVDGNYSSWYFNSPIDPDFKYETYIIDELVPFIDKKYKTIASREGRAISGLSMGGHGALYLSFKHQDVFGAAGSMSGGVDFRPFPENWDIKKRLGSITDFPENWEKNTVVNMLGLAEANNLKLIIDCGVDDFFIDVNRQLHEKMLASKINHDYIERPGKHNIDYWENALKFQLLFFHDFFNDTVKTN